MAQLLFKQADTAAEFQQIHALNHRVFAEEIAQHHTESSGLLIDRLDHQNTYFIALRDDRVIGMISAHSGPIFSVTRRLPDPQSLSQFPRPFEARLLAIDPRERNRTILSGLLWQAYDFVLKSGGSHLLISAITEREPMYRKLGFQPLGPAIPEGAASFIPMVMDMQNATPQTAVRAALHQRRHQRSNPTPISLMPGPVCIHPQVAQAFAQPPVSHRSPDFTSRFEHTRDTLRSLIPGMDAAIFPGAGTLANDVVAANLKAIFADAPGLVLINGEFGERVATQARQAGLHFTEIRSEWGQPWPLPELLDALEHHPAWAWGVHVETSTGVLNDAASLLTLAQRTGCAIALDCVSSLGAVPIPTGDALLLASGVSGKSLGSYAGLAFAYASHDAIRVLPHRSLCPSFDIVRMLQTRGPISTVASPLISALATALDQQYSTPNATLQKFQHYASLGKCVREQMSALGLKPLAPCDIAAPHITTFPLPNPRFPKTCLEAGFHIAHESAYLQQRSWGQIATMGNITTETLAPLFTTLNSTRR